MTIFQKRYILGEAENVATRLSQHLKSSKMDFKEFICFTSKDELLTKAHIKYLEREIINLAKKAKTSEIDNTNTPSEPLLHEAEISDMQYFLEQIKLILPVAGFKVLIPSVLQETIKTNHDIPIKQTQDNKYFIKRKDGLNATMIETKQGYVVLKGSTCLKKTTKSIADGRIMLRKKLLDTNILIEKDTKLYEFTEDYIFSSSSAAASIILGKQTAGPIAWKDANDKTYKSVQEQLST